MIRTFGWVSLGALVALAGATGCASRDRGGGLGGYADGGPMTIQDPNLNGDGGDVDEPEVPGNVIEGIMRMDCTGEETLAVNDGDAKQAARAIGLCAPVEGADDPWGLLAARYTSPDGTGIMDAVSHGILPAFGAAITPIDGPRLLALSSGTARQPNDPDFQDPAGAILGPIGEAPPGFPVDIAGCSGSSGTDNTTYDGSALEITVRAPKNAKSMRFNVNFYTYEFPEYVCSDYNDFFVVLQSPPPNGAKSGNVAFDSMGNPISVNNAFVEVCESQNAGGKNFPCSLGAGQLNGTGFEDHAATGWLEVVTPVDPGSTFTLRFAIWDAGDPVLDSTVLIDDVRFDVEELEAPVIVPVL